MSIVDGTKVMQTTRIHISIDRVSLLDFMELLVVLQIVCGQRVLPVISSATFTFVTSVLAESVTYLHALQSRKCVQC
jgi:hypothetical protein